MKVITYQVNGKTRIRGFKDSDLHSLINNKQITLVSVAYLSSSPGQGVEGLMAWFKSTFKAAK